MGRSASHFLGTACLILAVSAVAKDAGATDVPTIPVKPIGPQPSDDLTAKGSWLGKSGTSVTIGGYIKLDALYSYFSDGAVDTGSARDFYVPHAIPTSDGSGASNSYFDGHAKETRLFIKTNTQIDGLEFGTHLEFDFISGIVGGNELVTNAYNPALRRAFLTVGDWVIGQDWTTFQNLVALPETLDFVAWPTDGTVFGRHPLVRYKFGDVHISLEDPETSVQGGSALNDDDRVPDLVGRYSFGSGAKFSIAGVVRQLRAEGAGSAFGMGISLAGSIPVGERDDFKFTVTTGEGIGRYAGVGAIRDAQLDAAGGLDTVPMINGFIAYRHWWNAKLRSTLALSALLADYDTSLTGTDVQKSTQTVAVNLLFSPVKALTTGLELRYGERELENGNDGSLSRLQFSVKYSY